MLIRFMLQFPSTWSVHFSSFNSVFPVVPGYIAHILTLVPLYIPLLPITSPVFQFPLIFTLFISNVYMISVPSVSVPSHPSPLLHQSQSYHLLSPSSPFSPPLFLFLRLRFLLLLLFCLIFSLILSPMSSNFI